MKIQITTRAGAVTGPRIADMGQPDTLVPLFDIVQDLADDLPERLKAVHLTSERDKRSSLAVGVDVGDEFPPDSGYPLLWIKVEFDDADGLNEAERASLTWPVWQVIFDWFVKSNWVFPAAHFCYEIGPHGKYNCPHPDKTQQFRRW